MNRRPGKYGIAFSTIKYWQKRAYELNLYNGLEFVGMLECTVEQLQTKCPREIGHDAIAAANAHSAQRMRNLLDSGNSRVTADEYARRQAEQQRAAVRSTP